MLCWNLLQACVSVYNNSSSLTDVATEQIWMNNFKLIFLTWKKFWQEADVGKYLQMFQFMSTWGYRKRK